MLTEQSKDIVFGANTTPENTEQSICSAQNRNVTEAPGFVGINITDKFKTSTFLADQQSALQNRNIDAYTDDTLNAVDLLQNTLEQLNKTDKGKFGSLGKWERVKNVFFTFLGKFCAKVKELCATYHRQLQQKINTFVNYLEKNRQLENFCKNVLQPILSDENVYAEDKAECVRMFKEMPEFQLKIYKHVKLPPHAIGVLLGSEDHDVKTKANDRTLQLLQENINNQKALLKDKDARQNFWNMNKQKILSGELFTLKDFYEPIKCKINSESVNENELENIFMSAEENPLKTLFDHLFTSNQLIIESTNPYDYGKLIATHSSIKEMTDEAKIQEFLNIFVSKIEDQIKNANQTDLDPGENTMKRSELQDADRFFDFVLNNEEVSNLPECPVCRELMVGGENNRFTFCFDEETICDISREQFQTATKKTHIHRIRRYFGAY